MFGNDEARANHAARPRCVSSIARTAGAPICGVAALPVVVVANASDPTLAYVTAACAGGWPPGVPITLTIDAGAPDAFGRLLAAPASGTFTAVAPGGAAPDGGC